MTSSSLVAIVGPTGAGKSALALAIARLFHGELINFDSVQVYRRLDVGSAKTPVAERGAIAHHLIDVIEPTEELTAGAFAGLARNCLTGIASRKALPILVGGTGFYLRSLLDGLSPAPQRNSPLRQRLNEIAVRRGPALHRFLRRVNGGDSARIHPNDHQKLIRAIEIAVARPEKTPRRPLSGFHTLKIGLNPPRADLYERLNRRSSAMFDGGLLEETRKLLNAGVPPTAKALQSLGYKQAVAVLENRVSVADAVLELQTKTRHYAKRQLTWFRREGDVHWLDGFGNESAVEQNAVALVTAFQSPAKSAQT